LTAPHSKPRPFSEKDWHLVDVATDDTLASGEFVTDGPPHRLWWLLSFCDPLRPKGTQYLGGAVVEAPDMASAITISHLLGINPGGAVAAIAVSAPSFDASYLNRRLTRDEVENMPMPPAAEVIAAPPIGKRPW
jgi:hypothetical protein